VLPGTLLAAMNVLQEEEYRKREEDVKCLM
jgi:hypothetical protein